ncbi:hypothetical protein MMPV_007963 [Pyropia vietnamensis]
MDVAFADKFFMMDAGACDAAANGSGGSGHSGSGCGGGKAAFLGYDEATGVSPDGPGVRVTVEQLCLQAYALSGGWTGLHAEGWPLRTLFTLLLWGEAVYADVADVFRTRYQRAPLDLATDTFMVRGGARLTPGWR